jgi:uroporphyrinogen decarboxylase
MKAYRELKGTQSFRQISESPDLSTEVSLQPWRAYGTDGCILFSDILTPLPGMGVTFDISERAGPRLEPLRSMDDARRILPLQPQQSTPFVGETLRNLRREMQAGSDTGAAAATVLGFVGLPFTLATYMVEGGPSSDYTLTKSLAFTQPAVLHEVLRRLADNIAQYALYQIESGAQVVQCFDSWAGTLSPKDYDVFAAPYQKVVIDAIKKHHPEVPVIIYINRSGALLERLAQSGADIVSLDWTVTVPEARRRMADKVGLQGNLDPMLLFAPDDVIKSRTEEIIREAQGVPHIMNLGHGIDANTPEAKAALFVDTVKSFRY